MRSRSETLIGWVHTWLTGGVYTVETLAVNFSVTVPPRPVEFAVHRTWSSTFDSFFNLQIIRPCLHDRTERRQHTLGSVHWNTCISRCPINKSVKHLRVILHRLAFPCCCGSYSGTKSYRLIYWNWTVPTEGLNTVNTPRTTTSMYIQPNGAKTNAKITCLYKYEYS